jgi:hypothetical protein
MHNLRNSLGGTVNRQDGTPRGTSAGSREFFPNGTPAHHQQFTQCNPPFTFSNQQELDTSIHQNIRISHRVNRTNSKQSSQVEYSTVQRASRSGQEMCDDATCSQQPIYDRIAVKRHLQVKRETGGIWIRERRCEKQSGFHRRPRGREIGRDPGVIT